jgi:tetratricopeptide (TPR) repeat protein
MYSIGRLRVVLVSTVFLVFLSCMANPHFVGGKNYVKQEVWEKAVTELELAVGEQPENAEAWYYLGWARGEVEDYGGAAQAFQEADKLSDQFDDDVKQKVTFFWEDLAARGQDLEKGGNYEEAAEKFEDALRLRPDHVASYNYIAKLYGQMGEVERAAEKFEKGLELDPGNDTTLTNYAKYLEDNGLEDRAIPLFEKLLEDQPGDEILMHHLAELYGRTGQGEEEMAIYKELGDATAYMNRAYDAFAQEDFTTSLEMYEKALLVAEPGSDAYLDAFYNGIVSAYKMEDYEKAIEMGERLVQEKPEDPQYWRILGNSYARVKRNEAALKALNKADKLEKGE